MVVRNPVEWTIDQFRSTGSSITATTRDLRHSQEDLPIEVMPVRRIDFADLKDAIAAGFDDFRANRTDVLVLCVLYPLLGLVLGRMASGYGLVPLLFPLASGFALVGPLAGLGLYEMSRRREQGSDVGWADTFAVLRSPSLGAILLLGVILVALFLLWLGVAQGIYTVTLGPEPPASIGSFVRDVFTTRPGWMLIIAGVGAGFFFALVVLAISVVSFPLLLDRKVGLDTAVRTSIRAVVLNPRQMAIWGFLVAAGLVLGSIPLFFGLVLVLPVLGHATWHLYRKLVPR